MFRELSLVSGLTVMAVMLTPQASSAAGVAPQSMPGVATVADSSLVANASYYRRYDDDRDYRYRNRTHDHRHYGYRHYRDWGNDHHRHYGYRHYRHRGDRFWRRWWWRNDSRRH